MLKVKYIINLKMIKLNKRSYIQNLKAINGVMINYYQDG